MAKRELPELDQVLRSTVTELLTSIGQLLTRSTATSCSAFTLGVWQTETGSALTLSFSARDERLRCLN